MVLFKIFFELFVNSLLLKFLSAKFIKIGAVKKNDATTKALKENLVNVFKILFFNLLWLLFNFVFII